jgi:hypothetical protein
MTRRPKVHLAFLCSALLLGCGGDGERGEQAPPAPAAAPAPAPAAISLEDLAGTWTMRTTPEDSDSTLVTFQLTATADTSGWLMQFPGQSSPVPMRILSVAGDSIVTHAGPYDSALRPGTMVTIHGSMRLQNGQLNGTTTATYATASGDSVVRLRTYGTRSQ